MLRLVMAAGLSLILGACASGERISADVPRGEAAYAALSAAAPQERRGGDYRLGASDTVAVTVFQEPELSSSPQQPWKVDAAGNLNVPLIGTVRAEGLTAGELASEIATRLNARYLVDPQVTVTLVGSVSQKVTVQGEVTEPGVYDLKGPTTLLEALALAKGETRVAALREVVLFRTVNGQRFGGVFDVRAIRAGKAADPAVLGNDVVVVGLSNAKNIWRDVLTAAPILNVLRPIAY
ncbi:polysaccharide biosynthesis/export family protein [Sphingomonas sp. GCM10030256]|uniref:polysaccharide biosynthesis/export family protein n=1 Tax=Sphingomonas sp. GCM10030256 TaxID=3273427 RepID=UPI0036094C21